MNWMRAAIARIIAVAGTIIVTVGVVQNALQSKDITIDFAPRITVAVVGLQNAHLMHHHHRVIIDLIQYR